MLLVLAGCAQAADPPSVAELLQALAPAPTEPLPFTERRMSPLLQEPLILRGELVIGQDGQIEKRLTEPVTERIRISATQVVIEQPDGTRTLNLSGDARWRAFHAGLAGLLDRDHERLERAFRMTLEVADQDWTLHLRPRRSGGAGFVTAIKASGRGDRLLGIRLEQGESDWQEMTFPGEGH